MERDKENFDGWMIDYMAGRLSEEDLQQFHALLNSDVFYKKRFKELSKEYAKYLIPHFAEEEANNYEKLLHRLDLKKRSHSLASSRYFSWRNMRRIAATVALLIHAIMYGMILKTQLRIWYYVRWKYHWVLKQRLCCRMVQ